MQLDREFLFIDELVSHYGFTKFDLIDYLNQDRLQLFAWVNLKSIYGFYKLDNHQKYSMIGCFDYKGIIKISNEVTPIAIGLQQPVEVETFDLIHQESIRNWRDQKPVNLSFPNKDFGEYNFVATPPKTMVQAIVNGIDSFERQTYKFELANNSENVEKQDFSDDSYSKYALTIQPSDLRVRRNEVENIIAANAKSLERRGFSDFYDNDISRIDELLTRLVKHGLTSINDIMTALKKDSRTEEGQRLYDVLNILIEVNGEEVIWEEQSGEEKKLSKKSIQNKLTKLKK